MGKGGGSLRVSDYFMSIHLGICTAGEGLALRGVRVGEREVWSGHLGDEYGRLSIAQQNLFGGYKKEGGLSGFLHWLPGGATQVLPTGLAKRLGLTRYDAPAYRNIASVWFTGRRRLIPNPPREGAGDWTPTATEGQLGFLWGSNNPYLRPVWFRMLRPSIGLNPAKALIPVDATKPNGFQSSNPAHMIYECLTNRDWGAGMSPAGLDRASFETSSDVFYDEAFGLSAKWVRQGPVENFNNEILDHVQATLFLNPRTGLMTLKPLRNDYDIAQLRRINQSNARITNWSRKLWGETANEIVVTWTRPDNEGEETVSAQDLANVAAQGGPISSSRNYYMVRSAALAGTLAQRDVATAGQPLATCQVEMNRSGWDVVTGEVVVVEAPEYNIGQIVMRVGEINKGEPGSAKISFSLMEDVFGIRYSIFVDSEDPPQGPGSPQPITTFQVITAPAMIAARAMGLSDPEGIEYPDAIIMVVAAPGEDDVGLSLWSDVTLPSGNTTVAEVGTIDLSGTALLDAPLPLEAASVINLIDDATHFEARDGDFLLIGVGGEEATEIAVVTGVSEAGIAVNRGVLDTIPRPWPMGTRIWNIGYTQTKWDPTVRADGDAVRYRLLSQTSRGQLPYEDAEDVLVTPSDRALRPLRPANVRVGGYQWGPVTIPDDAPVTVTWANRNRLTEASVALPWTDSSVGPEAGQTTTVTVLGADRTTVLSEFDGLTGTSWVLEIEDFQGEDVAFVRVSSERDGFTNLQAFEIEVRVSTSVPLGYGAAYGAHYGG